MNIRFLTIVASLALASLPAVSQSRPSGSDEATVAPSSQTRIVQTYRRVPLEAISSQCRNAARHVHGTYSGRSFLTAETRYLGCEVHFRPNATNIDGKITRFETNRRASMEARLLQEREQAHLQARIDREILPELPQYYPGQTNSNADAPCASFSIKFYYRYFEPGGRNDEYGDLQNGVLSTSGMGAQGVYHLEHAFKNLLAIDSKCEPTNIHIVAHADSANTSKKSDTEFSPHERSLKSALGVRQLLIDMGASPQWITIDARGDTQPQKDLGPDVREPLNRHIDVRVVFP